LERGSSIEKKELKIPKLFPTNKKRLSEGKKTGGGASGSIDQKQRTEEKASLENGTGKKKKLTSVIQKKLRACIQGGKRMHQQQTNGGGGWVTKACNETRSKREKRSKIVTPRQGLPQGAQSSETIMRSEKKCGENSRGGVGNPTISEKTMRRVH